MLTSASGIGGSRQRVGRIVQYTVDRQSRQTADEVADVIPETARPVRPKQVRRQSTDEQRSEHVEHVSPVDVVGHVEHGRCAVVDADDESLLALLAQFDEMPLGVVEPAAICPRRVATSIVDSHLQATVDQFQQQEVRCGAFVVCQKRVSTLSEKVNDLSRTRRKAVICAKSRLN